MRAVRAGVRSRRVVAIGAALALAASCAAGDEAGSPSGSTANAGRPAATRAAGAATAPTSTAIPTAPSLADSQMSASTVPRPATPPPCAGGEVAVWTAQVRANGDGVDAVLRVANVGDRWCEVDISRSPRLDPHVEPDVWLEPSEWAELVVGPTGDDCDRPEIVTQARLAVGEDTVHAPTSAVVPCGWAFTSFLPLDRPARPCRHLAAAMSGEWLVVTNRSSVTCRLGELTDAGALGVVARRPPEPAVTALAPGDLAGFALLPGDGCAPDIAPLEFADGPVVEVEVVEIERCVRIELGRARPVLAGASGLLGEVDRLAPVDVAAIVTRLAPFFAP